MRKTLSLVLLAAVLPFWSALSLSQTAESTPRESLLIGPGDLLRVTVLGESELSQKVRVRDSGKLTLPLIGDVEVGGLSTAEASTVIARKYVDAQLLKHPEVSVFIEEYATQTVSVLGQVVKPGAISISTARTLVDVLAMAGGLTEVADRHITVERGGAKHEVTEVFLSNKAEDALNADIEIFPGDKILVPKARRRVRARRCRTAGRLRDAEQLAAHRA
jgi:polysaccharide biosynthesis/export protein